MASSTQSAGKIAWVLVCSERMGHGISIITAIHNGLAMNELFWETLCSNTVTPFELILVDNHSTDGSEAFFQKLALQPQDPNKKLVYLRNQHNQSYPQSQIQGMEHSRYDVLCFLNNDTWMPVGWHLPLENALAKNPLLVVSPSGQEAQPTQKHSTLLKRRWQWKYRSSIYLGKLLGWSHKRSLGHALKSMYGDLEHFQSPTPKCSPDWIHGIKGDCVLFHKALLQYVPRPWNPMIEAADWHLYLTVASLREDNPYLPLPRIILDSYVHHFGRYTAKKKTERLDRSHFVSIENFWGSRTVQRLWWGYQLPSA